MAKIKSSEFLRKPDGSLRKPDGYFHRRITLYFSPLALLLGGAVSYFLCRDFFFAGIYGICSFFGCLLGVILDPDLDQEMVSSSEWFIVKIPILGLIISGIWVGYWLPYALLTKHRGLSHWPVFGTLTRVLWLIPAFFVIRWFLLGDLNIQEWLFNLPCLCMFLGLCLADFGHYLRDYYGLQL